METNFIQAYGDVFSSSLCNNIIEIYEREPFPKKVRDKDALIRYMDADDRVSDANLKVEYYDVMINYTESILKQISNRTYQIKNSIEWHKFQAGFT